MGFGPMFYGVMQSRIVDGASGRASLVIYRLSVCSQRKWDNQAWEISDTLRVIALFPGTSIIVPSFF